MRAINHALTGAFIGLTVSMPEVALPLAFMSHFVCDAIPHYDYDQHDKSSITTKAFRNFLIFDAALCLALVGLLAIKHPLHWLVAAVCAFLAVAPDFSWLNRLRQAQANKVWQRGMFNYFAGIVQWFARPIGGAVELAWFMAGVAVLLPFIR